MAGVDVQRRERGRRRRACGALRREVDVAVGDGVGVGRGDARRRGGDADRPVVGRECQRRRQRARRREAHTREVGHVARRRDPVVRRVDTCDHRGRVRRRGGADRGRAGKVAHRPDPDVEDRCRHGRLVEVNLRAGGRYNGVRREAKLVVGRVVDGGWGRGRQPVGAQCRQRACIASAHVCWHRTIQVGEVSWKTGSADDQDPVRAHVWHRGVARNLPDGRQGSGLRQHTKTTSYLPAQAVPRCQERGTRLHREPTRVLRRQKYPTSQRVVAVGEHRSASD